MYFTDGYNDAEQVAFESAVNSFAKEKGKFIDIKKVSAIEEAYEHINKQEYDNPIMEVCAIKKVARMHVYAHGDYKGIHFGYSSSDVNPKGNQSMSKSNLTMADKSGFSPAVEVWSYACRTGISIYGESFSSIEEAKPEGSLAQKMADTWQVKKVYAWYSRTYYKGIWNDGGNEIF